MDEQIDTGSMIPSGQREGRGVRVRREELVDRLTRALPQDGRDEPLKGLHLRRESSPTECAPTISDPVFCVIAQGSKDILLGDDRYRYDPLHYLLVTAQLPIVSQIVDASRKQPFLSLYVKLDPSLVSAVIIEAGHISSPGQANVRAIDVNALDEDLLDAVVRLVRLLDAPTEAPFLAPLIKREIIYRLLRGEQGGRLRQIVLQDGTTHHIVTAVKWLREAYDQPLEVDDLAQKLGMSVSSFYHHFKAVTGMSPLQYQKQIRLQEARRLMLAEDLNAASTGYRVGYNDPSHFSRDYKRLFGLPPLTDVERLQAAAE